MAIDGAAGTEKKQESSEEEKEKEQEEEKKAPMRASRVVYDLLVKISPSSENFTPYALRLLLLSIFHEYRADGSCEPTASHPPAEAPAAAAGCGTRHSP